MNENPAFRADAPRVVVETNLGSFVIGLYDEEAPVTVANFLSYVEAQHFDGTVFHRVLPGFMIQGGGFVRPGEQFVRNEVRPPIVLESDTGLKNYRGAVAMAGKGVVLTGAYGERPATRPCGRASQNLLSINEGRSRTPAGWIAFGSAPTPANVSPVKRIWC